MGNSRLSGLDALRGIAALCVVLFHARPAWMGNAFLAVDFFFMLSGYVMARTYEARLADGLSPVRFIALRYMRLWPTMLIGGLLAVPMFVIEHGDLPAVMAANLLLLPVPILARAFLLNAPAWSIFFELCANALHGWVLFRLPDRRLAMVVLAAACVLALYAQLFDHSLEVGMRAQGWMAGLPRVMMSYGLGVLLWRRWRDNPPFAPHPLLIAIAMPVYFIGTGLLGSYRWPLDLLFVLAVFPLLVAGGVHWRRVPRVLVWLGAVSFPLYAVHSPLLMWSERLHVPLFAGIAGCLAMAALVEAIERKLRLHLPRRAVRPATMATT